MVNEYNPCASVSIPKNLPKQERKAASTTDEEIIKKSADVWLFPYIAIMTGMRKGEILALQRYQSPPKSSLNQLIESVDSGRIFCHISSR